MMKMKVSKAGGAKIKEKLAKLKKLNDAPSAVKVGVPVGAMNYPDGTNLVMVAAVHEFGSLDDRIPERSYLRSTMIEKANTFRGFWRRKHAKEILTGNATPDYVLNLLGLMGQSEVQKKIKAIQDPPNSAATIKAKGSENPLIDKGLLIQSITYEVDP